MAKNRKTKKEKLRSTQRISQTTVKSSSDDLSTPESRNVFTFVSAGTTPAAVQKNQTATIIHLREDLMRTGTVIAAIIIAELILFYTLTMS